MSQNNFQGGFRDPIWQFLGVLLTLIIFIFYIFIWFFPSPYAFFSNHTSTAPVPTSIPITITSVPTSTPTNPSSAKSPSENQSNNIFNISFTYILMSMLVASIISLIGEFIVGWRLPFGFLGSTLAGSIGALVATKIILTNFPNLILFSFPVTRGLLGAITLVILWHLLSYGLWHRRRRYYRRY